MPEAWLRASAVRGKGRVCAVRITSSVLCCYLLQTQHVATYKGPHSVTRPKQKGAEGERSRGSEKVRKPAPTGRWGRDAGLGASNTRRRLVGKTHGQKDNCFPGRCIPYSSPLLSPCMGGAGGWRGTEAAGPLGTRGEGKTLPFPARSSCGTASVLTSRLLSRPNPPAPPGIQGFDIG